MLPGLSPITLLSGAAGGVTPGAANWGDIDGTGIGFGQNATQEITGIGEPIMLRAEMSSTTASSGAATLNAYVNGVLAGSAGIADSATIDFTVNAGDDVHFDGSGSGDPSWSVTTTVTVKYKSAGSPTFDQTLDTFTATFDQTI